LHVRSTKELYSPTKTTIFINHTNKIDDSISDITGVKGNNFTGVEIICTIEAYILDTNGVVAPKFTTTTSKTKGVDLFVLLGT